MSEFSRIAEEARACRQSKQGMMEQELIKNTLHSFFLTSWYHQTFRCDWLIKFLLGGLYCKFFHIFCVHRYFWYINFLPDLSWCLSLIYILRSPVPILLLLGGRRVSRAVPALQIPHGILFPGNWAFHYFSPTWYPYLLSNCYFVFSFFLQRL